jgi:hypothetical protein
MQKNNKKASILLWAIMLSLIVAITFISISSKINKNIKLNWNIKKFNEERKKINFSILNKNNQKINFNKTIIFEDKNEKFFSLKKYEEKQITFSWSSDFNIDISIINWWPINYKYIFDWNITSSWIIVSTNKITGKLDNSSNNWKLILKNLWWYVKIFLQSENEFEEIWKKYKIITKVWNILLNEKKWEIK